jgi:hypothetical protein
MHDDKGSFLGLNLDLDAHVIGCGVLVQELDVHLGLVAHHERAAVEIGRKAHEAMAAIEDELGVFGAQDREVVGVGAEHVGGFHEPCVVGDAQRPPPPGDRGPGGPQGDVMRSGQGGRVDLLDFPAVGLGQGGQQVVQLPQKCTNGRRSPS